MARDFDRAYYLKQLLDEQMKKVDHTKDSKARMEEACGLMDKLVGPAWRLEIKLPGIQIINVTEGKQDEKETLKAAVSKFYDRVDEVACEDGMGEGPDAPEDPEELKKRVNVLVGKS